MLKRSWHPGFKVKTKKFTSFVTILMLFKMVGPENYFRYFIMTLEYESFFRDCNKLFLISHYSGI